jgi:mRNA-degrading endonuclease RelE of RelBE toxin-antitoxin system
MYSLRVEKRVLADLRLLPPKIYRQITNKMFQLQFNPRPTDSKKIGSGLRVDCGEYRLYYEVYDGERLISVELFGKRNDDEIYRRLVELRR